MAGLPNEKVISIIRGPQDTVITLHIKRSDSIEIPVTRDEINVSNVTGELLDNHIGYIGRNQTAKRHLQPLWILLIKSLFGLI